ncbi:helix-turn-helix domain-containing protein [Actinophytocola sediminis]
MGDWSIVLPGQQVSRLPELLYRHPHPLLSAHVLSYTARDHVRTEPAPWQFTPLCVVMVGIDLVAPARTGIPLNPVCGLHDRPVTAVEHPGQIRGIGLGLTPLGAHALFGVPLGELANRVVSLGDLLGTRAGLLAEQLAEIPDWPARFQLLDETLLAWLRAGPELTRQLRGVWQRLTDSAGRVRIGALADELGWTRQHLATRFRQHIGLTPKTVARMARLHLAMSLLASRPLADVALACGYADQAHLNRDFRLLTGTTPTSTVPADPPRLSRVDRVPV